MVTIPELAAEYHRADTMRKDLDQRILRLPHGDIIGRDLLLVEMDAVMANLDEVAGRLAAIPAHDFNDLRAKATVLLTMQDREAEDAMVLSLSLAGDILKSAR
jgi:hypothetical protein